MSKNKNKESPKQNKGQTAEVQNAATDNNNKAAQTKGAGNRKDNAGKDFYTQPKGPWSGPIHL